ncbi:hypothetical protein Tco_0841407 [Tanacetum coccineum]|uniref:Xylulose kinase-1 n=1 Tax=Tanacetum coccineum TaxID=301880 RepID=A0ABQ5AWH3_9ASTR
MSSLKFAETHNVVAFLENPEESDGFTEIIDFLKASSVSYALTVNPVIYTSCIEQIWATAKVQTVNGVRQLQALVDKKRVIVTESSIRRDLHLDDAGGTDCLPTATIFEELARMGAKSTTWNEFSSSMASLIICLATNQKFNLSKYIFDAMVKHLDGGVKFLLYPRFLQVFINQQLGNMSTHKKIFVNPFHTKKVFANMKRAGKDFSRRITPLFDTMMVQPVEEMGEDSDHPTDSTPIPIIDQPSSSSQPKKDKSSKKAQRQEAEVPQDEAEHEESVPTPSNDPKPSAKDAQAKEITTLKKESRVWKLRLWKYEHSTRTDDSTLVKQFDYCLPQVSLSSTRDETFKSKDKGKAKWLARKQEGISNIALIESWENTQAMMEADRLQSKEREELTNEEKAKLFMELLEKRRKHFASLRAQQKKKQASYQGTKENSNVYLS